MTRKFSLLAGLLLGSLAAGNLVAQAPTTKPAPGSSSMQHAPAPPAARSMHQDSVSSSNQSGVRHTVWTKDQIKEAQAGLAKAGYYKGQPTGVLNRSTRKAIRAYQKANQLPVTGRLSNDLLTRLKSA